MAPPSTHETPKPPKVNPWIDRVPKILQRLSQMLDRKFSVRQTGFLIAMAGAAVVGLLQMNLIGGASYNYAIGSIALADVRVPRDLLVEDKEATRKRRDEVRAAVLPTYDLDPEIAFLTRDRMLNLLAYLRLDDTKKLKTTEVLAEMRNRFGLTFSSAFVKRLRRSASDESVDLKLRMLLNRLYENWIVPDKSVLLEEHKRGIELRFLQGIGQGDEEDRIIRIPTSDYDRVLGMQEARKYLEKQALTMLKETRKTLRSTLVLLASRSVRPNLIYNRAETERRGKGAAAAVKPVLVQFSKGEILLREGERVTEDHFHRVQLLLSGLEQRSTWRTLIGTFVFALLAYLLLLIYPMKPVWKTPHGTADKLFIVFSMSLLLGSLVAGMPVVDGIHRGFPALSNEILLLGFPVASMIMIARVIYLPRYAIYYALIASVLVGYLVGNPWAMFVYFAGGTIIAMRLKHIRRRSMFFATGLQAGLVQAIMATAIFFMRETRSFDTLGLVAGSAVTGGILSAFIAMALLPLFEWLFNFTTDIKLVELGEDDQPLLRWLHIQAPGTYNHSVNVGRLAEVAAEAIGADALLVKVGAYYHDVGKGLMPQYFVENQKDYNPHVELKPSMSALTIIRHVNQGREMALDHHLPEPMIDFIMEHHGNSLVEYFFTKALDMADADDPPEESTFRYPGPKPQTKESGILMLADVVEATSRVLQKPTEANIRGMIHRLINKIFAEGQLDECPLTLHDLHAIAKSFSVVLTGMLHARVPYPSRLDEQPARKKKIDDRDTGEDTGTGGDDEPDGEDGRTHLKRLGIS